MSGSAELVIRLGRASRAAERTPADVRTPARRAIYDELVGEEAGRALGLARRLLGDHAEAEDAVQEAYLRAWRGLGRLEADRDARPWFFRILVNVARDRIRRRVVRRKAEGREPASPRDPAGRAAQRDLLARLWVAIEALPDRQRACLLLRARGGLAYAEIARLLGIAPGSVGQHLVRARHALAERFGDALARLGRDR